MHPKTKTLSKKKLSLNKKIAVPNIVANVCIAVLTDTANETTIKACLRADDRLWKKYGILRLVGGSNPKYVNNLKDEALPLIVNVLKGGTQ
ncbi:MAG: hypothetical protein HZC38_14500 [Chloroflexi bacterium]|nr:hypothetical protein [Chloroflexota bacterium]MBI5714608.1 hypothetical protein [Chloroflexota bacterium]